jgi:hypothetical protein
MKELGKVLDLPGDEQTALDKEPLAITACA